MQLLLIFVFLSLSISSDAEVTTSSAQATLENDDHDTTLSEVGVVEDTFKDLEGMWEETMETSGSQADSTADELLSTDLEEEISDLKAILEMTEDFEIVVIDGIEYTQEELIRLIEEKEEELNQTYIDDLELDLNILLEFAEDTGNHKDFENAMNAAESLILLMGIEDIVTVNGTDYDKDGLIEMMNNAKIAASDEILSQEISDMMKLEVGSTEDSIETYIEEINDIMQLLQEGEEINIGTMVYNTESISEIIGDLKDMLIDLDEGNDLDDEIEDIADQFAIEDFLIDDYEDENEEITEVLAITKSTIEVSGVLYSEIDLNEKITANKGEIQNLQVLEAAEGLLEIYQENDDALRLDYEDFYKGMQAVQDLVDLMDSDDLVALNDDTYSKLELQELVDSAYEYSESQSLQAAIVGAEENIITAEPTSEMLNDEISLLTKVLNYMDADDVITIDGQEYTIVQLIELIEELEEWLKDVQDEERKNNEIGDVQTLLEIYQYVVDIDKVERLLEELEEFELELLDGDTIIVNGLEIGSVEIEIIIEEMVALADALVFGQDYILTEKDSIMQLVAV